MLSDAEKVTVSRILKVNHAGEAGAIRIYQAQIFVCRLLHASMLEFLTETLDHEIEHRRLFYDSMKPRGAAPCRALWLWGMGGSLLGFAAALMGKNMIWICTEAVEETVHRHLEDQLHYLRGRDDELVDVIDSIREEELSHLTRATQNISNRSRLTRFVSRSIELATEIVIFLSTQGDSVRLARSITRTGV